MVSTHSSSDTGYTAHVLSARKQYCCPLFDHFLFWEQRKVFVQTKINLKLFISCNIEVRKKWSKVTIEKETNSDIIFSATPVF